MMLGDHARPIIIDRELKMPLDAKCIQQHQGNVIIVTVLDAARQKKVEEFQSKGVHVLFAADADGRIDLHDTFGT